MSQAKAETKAGAAISNLKDKVKAKIKRLFVRAHPLKIPNSEITPLAWHEIQGWMDDDHAEAFATFLGSCRPILRSSTKARSQRGDTYQALHEVCDRAIAAVPLDTQGARAFFEQNFRPVQLTATGEKEGFFTGYYEPVVEGSRTQSDVYNTPLYRRPNDMLTQRLRRSARKGKAGKRVAKRATAPYFTRAQIEDGALAGRDLEIAWLKSPIDAFFAEIQGSVRVRLEDGSVIRLNYASANGHPYFPVGSVLVQKGIVPREEMSMQKIREYMETHPEEGRELRRMNKSYVFFRETDLTEFDEAIGAQGISLTAARSIAVDRKIHTYGMPVFVNALLPIASKQPDTWFRRLMVAQDTGGAIIGPARADIYLGAGDEAERAAGRFKHPGQFVMLIPNELDPDDTALGMPLPQPRPKDGMVASFMSLFKKPKVEKEEAGAQAVSEITSSAPAEIVPEPRPKPAMKPEAVLKPAAAQPEAAPKRKPAAKEETNKPETKRPEAKRPEPKQSETKRVEPKRSEARPPETKSGNPFPKPAGVAPPPATPAAPARPSSSDLRL